MDAATITQLIGSLGFPIVACGAMYWQMLKQAERHEAEMDKIREALENNTRAILELTTLFRERGDLDGNSDKT